MERHRPCHSDAAGAESDLIDGVADFRAGHSAKVPTLSATGGAIDTAGRPDLFQL